MQAKVPAPGQGLMRYIAERDTSLHLIEEARNNMKKKSGKPSEKASD